MADNKSKGYNDGIDEEAEFITLEFDDGDEVECEIMGVFEAAGKNISL